MATVCQATFEKAPCTHKRECCVFCLITHFKYTVENFLMSRRDNLNTHLTFVLRNLEYEHLTAAQHDNKLPSDVLNVFHITF